MIMHSPAVLLLYRLHPSIGRAQEFILRNQVLGVLYRHHNNPPFMPVDEIPFLTCLRVHELIGAEDPAAVESLIWTEPLDLLINKRFPPKPEENASP